MVKIARILQEGKIVQNSIQIRTVPTPLTAVSDWQANMTLYFATPCIQFATTDQVTGMAGKKTARALF